MLGLARHLSERRLFECYLAERGGEGVAPPLAEHLADCRRCNDAYAQFVTFMDDAWVTADAETSEVFTSDHLHLQQAEIARRLEVLGHGGRVLSFPFGPDARSSPNPGRPAGQPAPVVSGVTSRWVVSAAAAGLFIGVAAGVIYDQRARPAATVDHGATMPTPVESTVPSRSDHVETSLPASAGVDPGNDDTVFMSELEAALNRPRTSELRALDAFTPHTREITYRIR